MTTPLLLLRKLTLNNLTWKDNIEIYHMKTVLKTSTHSSSFNTNVLKHCINNGEERLAWIIISRYQIDIDDKIIEKAIHCNMLEVLRVIWTYSKNFHFKKKFFYSFYYLFDKIQNTKHNILSKVDNICQWKVRTSENILKCLLERSWDNLAIKHAEFYIKDADCELLKYCIKNENEQFLIYALNNKIFVSSVLNSEKSKNMILDMFNSRTRCDYLVNILMYCNFHYWSNDQMRLLYYIIFGIQSDDIENNLLLMFYNPILSLAILWDVLHKIGNTSSTYKRPANVLSQALQDICYKLSENLNEELVSRVYMETNFKGQTLLRIVVNLDLEPLIKSQKVEELIETLWTGKETYECDGRTAYFSKLTYISKTKLRFLPGKDFMLNDLISQDFDFQYENEKFWYQFDFRRYSIKYIFTKELISVILLTIFFQYVNYVYLQSFRKELYSEMSLKDQYNFIENDLNRKFSLNKNNSWI